MLVLSGCVPPKAPPPMPVVVEKPRRPDPTGEDTPLAALFQALDRRERAGVITILQLGDSHTANDSFSGQLRDRFQARFGAAGRGMLQAGEPFLWYRPHQVHVESAGWWKLTSYGMDDPGPFGLGAVRQEAVGAPAERQRSGWHIMPLARPTQPGPATATLTAPENPFDTAEIEMLDQPGGGTVEVSAPGGAVTRVTTAGPGRVRFVDVPVPAGSTRLDLRAVGDGPVAWLGWSTRRAAGGVTLANLGYPGATAAIMDRWDWDVVRAELDHLRPALIVVAYGTNEGFKDGLELGAYEAAFGARLRALRAAAPEASVIVLGPMDGERARRRRVPEGVACDRKWAVPPNLGAVRAVERNAAAETGAWWFDWSGPMGGTCGMAKWVGRVPPLGMPDHVHLRSDGYAITANVLFDTLMHRFDAWRAATGGP